MNRRVLPFLLLPVATLAWAQVALAQSKPSLPPSPLRQQGPVWVEDWTKLDLWDTASVNNDGCYSVSSQQLLAAHCQSDGVVSRKAWRTDRPLGVFVTVQGAPAKDSTDQALWAGISFINDVGFLEVQLTHDYPAMERGFSGGDNGIDTSDTFTHPAGVDDTKLMPYVLGTTHLLSVEWFPDRQVVSFCADAVCHDVPTVLTGGPMRVETVVASVLPATPNDGSWDNAAFGPLTVMGTLG